MYVLCIHTVRDAHELRRRQAQARAFVDGATGDVSRDDDFAVRAEDARGLPA